MIRTILFVALMLHVGILNRVTAQQHKITLLYDLGSPVERARVELYNELSGEMVFQGETDKFGQIAFGETRTSLIEEPVTIPTHTLSSYPNPFSGQMTLVMNMPANQQVDIAVFDILGRKVSDLGRHFIDGSPYQMTWDGRNQAGSELAPGMYLVVVQSRQGVFSQKVVKHSGASSSSVDTPARMADSSRPVTTKQLSENEQYRLVIHDPDSIPRFNDVDTSQVMIGELLEWRVTRVMPFVRKVLNQKGGILSIPGKAEVVVPPDLFTHDQEVTIRLETDASFDQLSKAWFATVDTTHYQSRYVVRVSTEDAQPTDSVWIRMQIPYDLAEKADSSYQFMVVGLNKYNESNERLVTPIGLATYRDLESDDLLAAIPPYLFDDENESGVFEATLMLTAQLKRYYGEGSHAGKNCSGPLYWGPLASDPSTLSKPCKDLPSGTRGCMTSAQGYRISKGKRKWHDGADIRAAEGTVVYAARTGFVVFAGWFSNYGNTVIIDHGDGTSTLYAHLSKIAVPRVNRSKPGTRTLVFAKQVIGNSGKTGGNYPPHLHFEIRGCSLQGKVGEYTDPKTGKKRNAWLLSPCKGSTTTKKFSKARSPLAGTWTFTLNEYRHQQYLPAYDIETENSTITLEASFGFTHNADGSGPYTRNLQISGNFIGTATSRRGDACFGSSSFSKGPHSFVNFSGQAVFGDPKLTGAISFKNVGANVGLSCRPPNGRNYGFYSGITSGNWSFFWHHGNEKDERGSEGERTTSSEIQLNGGNLVINGSFWHPFYNSAGELFYSTSGSWTLTQSGCPAEDPAKRSNIVH